MNLRSAVAVVVILQCSAICIAQQSIGKGQGAVASASPKSSPAPMEAVFKNIQVLKGVPSTELLPIMHFMRASLGVRCEYCHVAESGKYRLDEKKAKLQAREMILMTRQLNSANFDGANVITCNTCHRGSVSTVPVPETGSTFVNTTRREPDETAPPLLPGAEEVFARYEGAAHVSALPAVRLKLQGSHAKVVDAGAPPRVIPRAQTNTGEDLIEGEKALARSPLPDGRFMLVGSNGKRAWTQGPDGLQWIPDENFTQFQRKLNPLLALRVRAADLLHSQVVGTELIGNREAYIVTTTGTDGTAEKLWFAKNDGLLLRRTFYHPIAFGLDPEQFDFSEYKNYGGFVLPSQINTSYLDDQHLGVLKKIIDIQLNVPVPERDFMPPDN
jgi:hypothetical protein